MIWLNANEDSLRHSIDLVGHDQGREACTIDVIWNHWNVDLIPGLMKNN